MAPWTRPLAAVALAVSLAVIVLIAIRIRVSAGPAKREGGSWPNSEERRLWKCCGLSEELDRSLNCVRRPPAYVPDPETEFGVIPNDPSRYSWIPEQFQNRSINLYYGFKYTDDYESFGPSSVIYREDFHMFPLDEYGNKKNPIDGSLIISRNFCVDTVKERGVVILYYPCLVHNSCFRKCCPRHQQMRRTANSVECVSTDPEDVSVYAFINETDDFIADTTFQRCAQKNFKLLGRASPGDVKVRGEGRAIRYNENLGPQENLYDLEVCVDSLPEERGSAQFTLAVCYSLVDAWQLFWHLSQPSCWVAALLLVFALAAVPLQPALRSTNHGRALVCHAVSLLFLNILFGYFRYVSGQPTRWQLGGEAEAREWISSKEQSRIVAYLILFCIHSANCWMTALCSSVVIDVRRMQREPAMTSRDSGEWGLFALYSSFGFGAPLVLTSLTVYVLEKSLVSRDVFYEWIKSFILPNLSETRTSFLDKGYIFYTTPLGNGSFYYYLLPTGIVLLINLGLFVYIFFLIRRAKKETDILRRPEAGRPDAARDSAWLYVLLSTSAFAAIIEIGTWMTTQDIAHTIVRSGEEVRYLGCRYEAPLNIIDVIRATIIFSLTCLNANMRQRIRTAMTDVVKSGRRLFQLPPGRVVSSLLTNADSITDEVELIFSENTSEADRKKEPPSPSLPPSSTSPSRPQIYFINNKEEK